MPSCGRARALQVLSSPLAVQRAHKQVLHECPNFAIIEVRGCGMRLRAMKDEGGWRISGWRRTQGAKAMVMFAAADTTPTFRETAGQHHHTFCAHMVMAGVPLRRVQLLAGHADYATTEKRYAHLTPDGDDGAVSKLIY